MCVCPPALGVSVVPGKCGTSGGARGKSVGHVVHPWGTWFPRGVHDISVGHVARLGDAWQICGVRGTSVGCMVYLWGVLFPRGGSRCIRGVHGSPVGYVMYPWGAWFSRGVCDVSVGCTVPLWGT